MNFRQYLVVLPLLLLLSCKKDTAPVNTGIPAATLLNTSYGSDPYQKMDIYLPADRSESATKVIVLVHGGAWFGGDKADFGAFIDSLKNRLPGYAIFNVNYRLSALPKNLFPTQELDVKAAVEAIYTKRAEYLVSNKFTMLGLSAGAHLALLHSYKNSSPVKIKAVADFFGPTDLVDLYNNPGIVTQFQIAAIIGTTPAANPSGYREWSPINYAKAATATPTIIFQGSADPLVSPRQSRALRDSLLLAGVPVQYTEYAGKGHGDDWDSPILADAFGKIAGFFAIHNP